MLMSAQLRYAIGVGAILVCIGMCLNTASTSQPPEGRKPDLSRAKFYGVAECKDCHVPEFTPDHDQVLLNEYPTWKTRDRHALAYAVLEGPRGQRMSELLQAEGSSALRRARLTRSFNKGYRSYSRTYNTCSPSAQNAINRFLTEGAQIADGLVKTVP